MSDRSRGWGPRLATALLLAAASAGTAAAQPAPPDPAAEARAQALYEQGTKHYDIAEYDEAIAAYKEAYKVLPVPLILYNIGQAYRLKGDCSNARTFYRNYLRAESTGDIADKARTHLAEMEKCAKPENGGGATATGPDAGLDGGADTEPDRPKTDGPETGAGADTGAGAGTGAGTGSAPDIDTGTADPGKTRRLTGLALGGTGVALVLGGVYFGLRASDKADELARTCTEADPCAPDQWRTLDDAGQRAQTLQIVGLAVGGVAVAAGAGLFLWGRSSRREVPVTVVPTRGGAAVGAAWTF